MRTIDVDTLSRRLTEVSSIRFALLFGSAIGGTLPKHDSDVDVAVYLDHLPDLDERARIIGLVQDAVASDRVDVIFLNASESAVLHVEALKGRLLMCPDKDAYAAFFSLADRRNRDEEDRIRRAWAIRSELGRSSGSRDCAESSSPKKNDP